MGRVDHLMDGAISAINCQRCHSICTKLLDDFGQLLHALWKAKLAIMTQLLPQVTESVGGAEIFSTVWINNHT